MSHNEDKPCGPVIVHPRVVTNPPGLDTIAYRVGDFVSFRDALLRPLDGETDLSPAWRPGPDDLGLQIVEWWAYLADVLTFYSERWMHGSFLRTAAEQEYVRRLVRLLGYRPRPAIAATATLAADVTAKVTLPESFAFQSKPGPGEEPQVFELDDDTELKPPAAVVAMPKKSGPVTEDGKTVWVRGTVSNVKAGDRLLVFHRAWDGNDPWAWGVVAAVEPDKDAFGKPATRVRFAANLDLSGTATDFRIARATRSIQPWPHNVAGNPAITATTIHLGALARDLRPGDLFLFDATHSFMKSLYDHHISIADFAADTGGKYSVPKSTSMTGVTYMNQVAVVGGKSTPLAVAIETDPELIVGKTSFEEQPSTKLQRVSTVSEALWFANGEKGDPTKPPADKNVPGVPILHSVVTFLPGLDGKDHDNYRFQIDVRYGWQDVGEVIAAPVRSFDGKPGKLERVGPVPFEPEFSGSVLLEGADGLGAAGKLSYQSANEAGVSELPVPAVEMKTPITVWNTLLPVSRGQTVEREVLGSGDARVQGQEFVLQKKPLTYLPIADPDVGRLYTSTLRVWVDGVQWREVSHFHGQPDDARVYVTSEDDAGKTHVRFAGRLPTGTNNVVASYRHGAGAFAAAGSLTMILKPRDGLRGVRNPVKAGGGADPEPADQMRRYAPRSVLTFDRAVSADDYEAIAAQAPGVTRARAYWTFDPAAQRGRVVVYVGDDTQAVESARTAVRAAEDPNRPATILPAVPVPLRVELSVDVAKDRVEEDVLKAVRVALLDPDCGVFGAQSARIGRALFDSELSAACFTVPGVLAVRIVRFEPLTPDPSNPSDDFTTPQPPPDKLPKCEGHRRDPGQGKFFTLASENLQFTGEVSGGN